MTLAETLTREMGPEVRAAVFRVAGVPEDRVYRMDRSYPDSELASLLSGALDVSGQTEDVIFSLFARTFLDIVEEVFPNVMDLCDNSEAMLRSQAEFHALIGRGMYEETKREKFLNKFEVLNMADRELSVRYRSPLQLCGLYRAIVRETAKRFGDTLDIATVSCRKKGSDACCFQINWTSIGAEFDPLERAIAAGQNHKQTGTE